MLHGIKSAFWLANVLEAGERMAYFGVRTVLPLMMVATSAGGLHLSYTQLGIIYGIWALLQCLIPMVSGGFSESFGYKKSLFVAFLINFCGYILMANLLPLAVLLSGSDSNVWMNFTLMLISACFIGTGTAIFKPPVQGVVAKSLNEKNSGIGFGIFYWVVNIGGFLAPMCASALRGDPSNATWSHVFYSAAFVTLFNFVVTLFFFKEPERTAEETAAHKKESMAQVFCNTLKNLWNDKRMLCFLLIVSGFWLMFMQLWDLLPNFLNEWTDRRSVGEFMLSLAQSIDGSTLENPGGAVSFVLNYIEADGALKPELLINIDSATILIFVLPLSAFFARYRMMTSLILGMVISVIGFIFAGVTMSGAYACLAIFIFAIGEIICSPKFSEYIGMTAPADKKAIYMGYSNIPFAIGWAFGNFLSGPLYQNLSSKELLARQWLVEFGKVDASSLDGLKLEELMPMVQNALSASTGNAVDVFQVNEVLWNAYHPWVIWIILGSVGVLSMIGMIVFYYKSGMKDVEEARAKADQESAENADAEKTANDASSQEAQSAKHAEASKDSEEVPVQEETKEDGGGAQTPDTSDAGEDKKDDEKAVVDESIAATEAAIVEESQR